MQQLESTLKHLESASIAELLVTYRDVTDKPATSRHKRHLIRSIAWALQARDSPALSSRARRRVAELVDPTDLRVSTATDIPGRPPSRRGKPIPGTVICRPYKGELLHVRVIEGGFEYEGQSFGSLSAVAKHITGSHWNGNLFFGLPSSPVKKKDHV